MQLLSCHCGFYSKRIFSLTLLILSIGTNTFGQSLLAGWDFQTTGFGGTAAAVSPASPQVYQANFGNGTLYLNGQQGAANWLPANQISAFSGTTLNAGSGFSGSTSGAASLALINGGGSANGLSMSFRFSMTGKQNLEVSYATQRSSTGFNLHTWQYSLNGVTWLPIQSINAIGSSFSVISLTTITQLNQADSAWIRVIVSGATGTSGNNRFDNIQLKAQSTPPPLVQSDSLQVTIEDVFSYQIQASGNPNSYQAGNLPAGISIDTLTGQLSGIIQGISGWLTMPIQATNASGTGAGTLTLFVNPASQVIQFDTIPDFTFGAPPFTLNATGGNSGNPVILASSDTNVAKINGNQLLITGTGTCTLTATQTGNTFYLAATPVSRSFSIEPDTQIITGSMPRVVYLSDSSLSLSLTGGGSGLPISLHSSDTNIVIATGLVLKFRQSGVCIITATQAGNTLYLPADSLQQTLVVVADTQQVLYTFGTSGNPTSLPTSGIPFPNLSISALQSGNNANISQTGLVLSTSSASANAGSSGGVNASITAYDKPFHPDSSAYFSFQLSPQSNYLSVLHRIRINTRSTSTGPTRLEVRSSIDGFQQSLVQVSVLNNSTWNFVNLNVNPLPSASPIEYRIYGYKETNIGSVHSGSANNWRLDDIQLLLSRVPIAYCGPAISVNTTPVICHGDSTVMSVSTTQAWPPVSYRLNTGDWQNNQSTFSITAGIYTLQVLDAMHCLSQQVDSLTEPPLLNLIVSDYDTCIGAPITLSGFPQGGTFSIPNPYTGSDTTYTYLYTDSVGCTTLSNPAVIKRSPCSSLALTLYLQGYYDGAGFMSPTLYNQGLSSSTSLVDSLTVELYDAFTLSLAAAQRGVLQTNGNILLQYPNVEGWYYLRVLHRNTLPTWSSSPVHFGTNTAYYDFSTSDSKAFGQNQILLDQNRWGLFTGDLSPDQNIDLLDMSLLEVEVENFSFGYQSADLNGDGNVDLLDLPLLESNISSFIFGEYPTLTPFPENMETGTKTTYSTATLTLPTGPWLFEDALLGNSTQDRKFGNQSARIQLNGRLTYLEDVFSDSSVVSVWHAKYGTDASSTWGMYYSTDSGQNWTALGGVQTSSNTALQQSTFVIPYSGFVRLQIRKFGGGRLNLDDFQVTVPTMLSSDNTHTALGNPSSAVTDVMFPNNYLLIKPWFELAYSSDAGGATWVAWHLDLSDLGTIPRCDCFAQDAQLPASFYRASSTSYAGSGFDRGHQVPSSHRTQTLAANEATFLMSNMLPQAPNLNQITWNQLEQYCVNLVNSGHELYTYSGGYGQGGSGSGGGFTLTLDNGNIVVPAYFWKIIVVLPVGNQDVQRIQNNTRVIAVAMPNTQGVSNNHWGTYRTSIDALEAATGFDFLSNLPTTIQQALESVVDAGPVN